MPDQSTLLLQSRVECIEQQFSRSSMARVYAYYHEKLSRFERAPRWKRILMGGSLRRRYLKWMLEWALVEYMWEGAN